MLCSASETPLHMRAIFLCFPFPAHGVHSAVLTWWQWGVLPHTDTVMGNTTRAGVAAPGDILLGQMHGQLPLLFSPIFLLSCCVFPSGCQGCVQSELAKSRAPPIKAENSFSSDSRTAVFHNFCKLISWLRGVYLPLTRFHKWPKLLASTVLSTKAFRTLPQVKIQCVQL